MDIIQVYFFNFSGPEIPEILYTFVDDNKVKERNEKVKGKNVELNEDDNEDNEKELELLVSLYALLDHINPFICT